MSEMNCRNCESRFNSGERFCSACGQSTAPISTTTFEAVDDWAEHYVGSHGALWRTLKTLLFSPGKLTAEYITGRRTMYLKPIQLYFLASILFFSAHKLLSSGGVITFDTETSSVTMHAEIDETIRNLPPWLAKRVESRVGVLSAMPRGELGARISGFASRALPLGLLCLVPVFAFFLKILWGWRKRYADHFVFALHLQATIFLFLIPMYLVPKTGNVFLGVIAFAMCVTLWRAFTRFYGGDLGRRCALLLPTVFVYFAALIAVMVGIVFLGFAIG